MNVSLTPELEQYVQAKVQSGLYTSVSEVVRESLRLMHQYDGLKQQQLVRINNEIEAGLQQLMAGEVSSVEQVQKRLKKQLKKKHET